MLEKRSFFIKITAILLLIILVIGLFPANISEAKTKKPGTPNISLKPAENGSDLILTINKTKNASGYNIWISGDISYTGYRKYYYNTDKSEFQDYDYEDTYIDFATLEKNGKKKRTVTLKSLPKGYIHVAVCAYNLNAAKGTKTYGDYGETVYSKVENEGIGYKTKYKFSKVKTCDTIKFGAYEQDNNALNGKEPIEWIVLEKTDDILYVLSKNVLDCVPYNVDYASDVTWESCTLRKWLNEEFYRVAFNQTEKSLISYVKAKNRDNTDYSTGIGGNDTSDRVWLMCMLDMKKSNYGFSTDPIDFARGCELTAYAKAQGALSTYSDDYENNDGSGFSVRRTYCQWWLRSPGMYNFDAVTVTDYGWLNSTGTLVNTKYIGVRPAMFIKLK